ncbi:acyloxyacyl hydrolase [Shimia sp. W99]
MKRHAFVLTGLLLATQAGAQEVILGLGYSDFLDSTAADAALMEVEYHHRPFLERNRLNLGWGAMLSYDAEDDFFFGGGLVATYGFDESWFVEGSLMPGAYFKGNPFNDLGHKLEFRSLLGIGHRINDRSALSLAIVHKSNASISATNPGVNSLLLRYHRSF